MKFGAQKFYKKKKALKVATIVLVFLLPIIGVVGLKVKTWANRAGMTQLWFSNALFCQRVSQAVNDSLGDGMADGGDCVNFNLYVSTANIGNIQTLNIVPPEGGFGNIDLESQPLNIDGDWVDDFYNLTSLSITDMYIQNISPLRRLRGSLTYLDLSGNRISDITPLETLEDNLVYLDLSDNPVGIGLRELSRFTELTTLKLANTGVGNFDDLFRPTAADIEYDDEGKIIAIYNAETEIFNDEGERIYAERMEKIPLSSNLAKALRVFDIHDNYYMSYEMTEEPEERKCEGALLVFETYPLNPVEMGYAENDTEPVTNITITELYASNNSLNGNDLICVTALRNLEKLDVSENHIDDFSSIRSKNYSMLKVDSQLFTRSTASLDYRPLPEVFLQAGQENYFQTASASNVAISKNELDMDNAQFYGENIRFINAVIASPSNENPHPAVVTVPLGSGAFENTRIEVYFEGQIITFNDVNLCSEVYRQGNSGRAFIDVDGNLNWSADQPVVLTNACNTSKQIAMISGGSHQFLRLTLDSINDGAWVDLTGLEEFDGLQVLSLQDNALTDLNKLSNDYQLAQLWLNDNNLANDDWEIITNIFTNLRILYLNNNYMSVIPNDLANVYRLSNLYLVNNGISDVSPLAYVSSLTVLDLSENEGITDFSGMAQEDSACTPSILKIENASIARIPNANVVRTVFANLTSLNLNGNQITDDTIANLARAARLDELYLNNNQISSTAGFSGVTQLRKLFLDNNQIEDVSGLTTLSRLVELHLNNNQISDIAGLNTLPALATLDLKNQTLTGTIMEAEVPYELPAVFSQATTMEFSNVSGFQSAGSYAVENGEIDYSEMTATITNTAETMSVMIPDGGLAGTEITITYEGGEEEFGGILTDRTGGRATITPTSSNSFTVTSDKACMVLWTNNNGTTWTRLGSNPVVDDDETRAFSMSQVNGIEVVIAYAGDANSDSNVNVRDARKIINYIMGDASLSNLERKLADINLDDNVNVRDARKIINYIMGTADINW